MQRTIIRLAGTGTVACLGLLAAGTAASAAPSQTGSAAGFSQDFGPPPVPVSGSCPFSTSDDASFVMVSGNMVNHGTSNKNGDWGGQTIEGIANFTVGEWTYTGHLTYWDGEGNNAVGQMEFGFTLDFHGSGTGGNLDVHVNGHMTVNASGTTTVDRTPGSVNGPNGSVTCS